MYFNTAVTQISNDFHFQFDYRGLSLKYCSYQVYSRSIERSFDFEIRVNNPLVNKESLSQFSDGRLYNGSNFYINNKNALRIQLYFYEFEVCIQIGNRKNDHKVGAFYYTINNLPTYLNSKLRNIHLLALCFNEDVFQFGINTVRKGRNK